MFCFRRCVPDRESARWSTKQAAWRDHTPYSKLSPRLADEDVTHFPRACNGGSLFTACFFVADCVRDRRAYDCEQATGHTLPSNGGQLSREYAGWPFVSLITYFAEPGGLSSQSTECGIAKTQKNVSFPLLFSLFDFVASWSDAVYSCLLDVATSSRARVGW